jgi:phosphoribosylglycinamide formyltransferase-1
MMSPSKAAYSMTEAKQKLGVLCSGRGTDLQSIMDAIDRGEVAAEIAVVLTDKPDAFALERAAKAGIKAVCVNRKQFDGRESFEQALVGQLQAAGVTLVVLAGFMRILTPYFVRQYAGRIMNIHPALLPSFPGAHAHRDVLAYGVKVSGCTVHFVDEGTDSGPIILQAAVPVLDGDTEETLGARVLEQEHIIYPRAIQLYCEGKLEINGRHVHIVE